MKRWTLKMWKRFENWWTKCVILRASWRRSLSRVTTHNQYLERPARRRMLLSSKLSRMNLIEAFFCITSMHSSRMRTARLFTVLGGGSAFLGGGGVAAFLGGSSYRRGSGYEEHLIIPTDKYNTIGHNRHSPETLWECRPPVNRQTHVKTLPSHNFVCGR